MSDIYTIEDDTGLVPYDHEPDSETTKSHPGIFIEIYTPAEFTQVDLGDDDVEEAIGVLSRSQGTSVNMLPDCAIGAFSIPTKDARRNTSIHFGFYLNPNRLIFIDTADEAKHRLDSLNDLSLFSADTTPRVLFEFMKSFVADDAGHLTELEKQMGAVEDRIVEHYADVSDKTLLSYRREMQKFDRFYQRLSDLAAVISRDEYRLFTKEDHRLFRLFEQHVDRLLERAQYLKEYSLQLRELYQMQSDAQQNRIIQWLTVVTTLVVPLTLITSWYGMNFENMPELEWPYAYFVVIALCVVLVVAELIFFKRRRLL